MRRFITEECSVSEEKLQKTGPLDTNYTVEGREGAFGVSVQYGKYIPVRVSHAYTQCAFRTRYVSERN